MDISFDCEFTCNEIFGFKVKLDIDVKIGIHDDSIDKLVDYCKNLHICESEDKKSEPMVEFYTTLRKSGNKQYIPIKFFMYIKFDTCSYKFELSRTLIRAWSQHKGHESVYHDCECCPYIGRIIDEIWKKLKEEDEVADILDNYRTY